MEAAEDAATPDVDAAEGTTTPAPAAHPRKISVQA